MRLSHLHLNKPIDYSYSLLLQEALLKQHFDSNEALRRSSSSSSSSSSSFSSATSSARSRMLASERTGTKHLHRHSPAPTLLTFQTNPTYTVGRRHLKNNPLSPSQIDFLTGKESELRTVDRQSVDEFNKGDDDDDDDDDAAVVAADLATFYASPRGGLLTYHAPGQLTAYLIYNLRYHGITPRCHIRLLEKAVINTCGEHGVPNTLTTDDPGVWIGNYATTSVGDGKPPSQHTVAVACNTRHDLTATNRKICAIGVHVSRGITSHGLGLNIIDSPIPSAQASRYNRLPASLSSLNSTSEDSDLISDSRSLDEEVPRAPGAGTWPSTSGPPAPGFLSWGFNRIVACGLEGKTVTWLTRERANSAKASTSIMQDVANTLAVEIARGLTNVGRVDIEGVDFTSEDEVLGR